MSAEPHAPAEGDFAFDLVHALAALEDIARNKTATVTTRNDGQYSYRYTDLGSIHDAVRPILAQHGIAYVQKVRTTEDLLQVQVRTDLLHVSGCREDGEWLGLPTGTTPQGTGSAITYARRYSLLAALGLATEDDDGQGADREAQRRNAERRANLSRTRDEAEVRRMLGELPDADRRLVMEAFIQQYGCRLIDLPPEQHPGIVGFVEDTIADLRDGGPPEVVGGGYREPDAEGHYGQDAASGSYGE